MMKRLLPLWIAAAVLMPSLFPAPLPAADSKKILILPLTVFSSQPADKIVSRIETSLKNQLRREGAVIVAVPGELPAGASGPATSMGAVRQAGAAAGADVVIWGSLSQFGRQLSLDLKLLHLIDSRPPVHLYAEGAGPDRLLGSLRRLGRSISMKVFEREIIADIRIEGQGRIESDAILRAVRSKPGDILQRKNLTRDLKKVYAMGYFEDVRVEAEDDPEGRVVIFRVKENPTIRRVTFSGNDKIKEKELAENLTVKTGAVLNVTRIRSNLQRIEGMYKEKNYHNIQVDYTVQELKNNQVDVAFEIEEGKKLKITEILFEGNKAFEDKQLKKIIETSETWFLSFITKSGELKPDELEQDVGRVTAFYQNNGFIRAKVGEPEVDFKEDGITITFKIVEGERYKVGNVDISGDLVRPKELLMARLSIQAEPFFSRERMRADVLVLTDEVSDEGYAYADVSPRIKENADALTVDVEYVIDKKNLVYFERIIIAGNTRTRDKVIRRELRVYEQELFSGRRLKAGIGNLYRLDFFEDIKVETPKGSSDDQMVLKIDVMEKETGTFSFGGGYSSAEEFFGTVSVTQRNFLGRGQVLNLSGTLGGRSSRIRLGFTEPWLFDIPLSAGGDLYIWDYEFDTYTKESVGFGLRTSYPVWNYTRAYLSYTWDQSDITDVAINASDSVKELEGVNVTSSITTSVRYNSTNARFNPTRGGNHSASLQYAGLGGDIGFTKIVLESGYYHPLFWKFTGHAHGKTGYVVEHEGMILPDYEKFYLGGINSLRGFTWEDLSPTEINSLGLPSKVGGDKFVQVNLEALFPLMEDAGLVGLVFYDTGDLYAPDENVDLANLRQSVGFGIRWFSPVGPIRLEYGYIIDPQPGESTNGRWEFSMGSAF